jgi:hypothetical protein
MCKVYNPVGSLTTVKQQLARNKIDSFHSTNELLTFLDSYPITRQQLISEHEAQITEKKNKLGDEVLQLTNEIIKDKQAIELKLKSEIESLQEELNRIPGIEKSFAQEFTYSFKVLYLLIQIKYKEYHFDSKVSEAIKAKVEALELINGRLQYIISNFDEEVKRNCGFPLDELDHKKRVIDEIKSSIYGAIGEQKVAKELEQLSDEYILINDFSYYFERSIHYRQTNQYIRTIQVDHLLISPAGIFLIETKNWSRDSLNNLSLRSPVEQIKRTNYVLYKILSDNLSQLKLDRHHWGDRKIPIKNLIVMVNHKPKEEFEHVTILTLNELLGYVKSSKPSLSNTDTQKIADYLNSIGTPNFGTYSAAQG